MLVHVAVGGAPLEPLVPELPLVPAKVSVEPDPKVTPPPFVENVMTPAPAVALVPNCVFRLNDSVPPVSTLIVPLVLPLASTSVSVPADPVKVKGVAPNELLLNVMPEVVNVLPRLIDVTVAFAEKVVVVALLFGTLLVDQLPGVPQSDVVPAQVACPCA